MSDIKTLEFRQLKANEIECRIAKASRKGISLLLYKNARCDMNILDETVGSMNWQRDHKEIKDNMYAGIGIYDGDCNQWVWKWDCGKESYTEKEKGEASDSFKRAGFNWGIGRELYTAPFIWIPAENLKTLKQDQSSSKERWICNDYYACKSIEYNNGIISYLLLENTSNHTRYEYGRSANTSNPSASNQNSSHQHRNVSDKPATPNNTGLVSRADIAQLTSMCKQKGFRPEQIFNTPLEELTVKQFENAMKQMKSWKDKT